MHELIHGLDYSAIHSVLITHTHEDHLDVDDIAHRRPTSAHFPEGEPPMIVYGSEAVYYHATKVCRTQTNGRELTVRDALREGLEPCPNCNPPTVDS